VIIDKGNGMRFWPLFILLFEVGCGPGPVAAPEPVGFTAVESAGLPNLFRVSDRLYSGGGPDGDAGFAELRRLGIRTIISVDGARPDAATAARYGMRYVHLPVGYNGIPRDKVLALVKAVRELPGPVYVHCHHGQHRGPAAVAVIQLCTDPAWDRARAEAWFRAAGTDPRYVGLIGLPRTLVPPAPNELAATPADFPEAAKIPDLARVMVGIDERWDRFKLVKAAGWKTPKDHPDLDPPHEAVQLAETFREAARLGEATSRGPEFVRHLAGTEAAMTDLERVLRASPVDTARANAAFGRTANTCTDCHARFRDRPGDR
jgi:protein tyrosine phosphatase (PTP) superfamily phosphohydrolase (DUF442 family)